MAHKNIRIEYHILQSFPVTCLNRDDVGAPKTARIGNSTRARVSSQCWKRHVRLALKDQNVKLGIRTKKVAQLVKDACLILDATEEHAESCGKKISDVLSSDTLYFISEKEVEAFASFAKEKQFDSDKLTDKDLFKVAKKALNPALDGLDIALFGRMVAKAAELNVEAAASFSHAISTHNISNELDFFVAMDDHKEEQGSAHMGTLEFNSATYYRYISLDLGQLAQSLEPKNLPKAVSAFTYALFSAVPSARQTTQSGASPWEFATVLLRSGQRLQVPFETPVKAKDNGFTQASVEHLKSYLENKEALFGSMFGKLSSYEWGENTEFTIDDLVNALQKDVAQHVECENHE